MSQAVSNAGSRLGEVFLGLSGCALRRRLAFMLMLAGMAWGLVAAGPRPMAGINPGQGGKDLQLYRQICERVHAGEDYYQAAEIELRALGYPTGSVFNWRTPVCAWFLAALPNLEWGRAVLLLLALTALVLWYRVLHAASGPSTALIGMGFLVGPWLWCLDGDAFMTQELWAGVLIALSAAFFALSRPVWGVALGLLALVMRELALPYVGIAMALAGYQGRRREMASWLAGLGFYAVFWTWHASQVMAHQHPGDRIHASWIQFGGASFLLSTCRMNAYLFRTPAWVRALYVPLAIYGFSGLPTRLALPLALTAGGYLAAFSIVGQPFNDYWGLLYAPLLALGLVGFPHALWLFWRAEWMPSSASSPASVEDRA